MRITRSNTNNNHVNIYSLLEAEQMPGLNQTGPAGYGPGTGRGMGPCGKGMAYGRGLRQGFGGNFGRSRGFCRNNFVEPGPLSTEAKKQLLEAELTRIEAEKAEIQRQLTSLE
jgi:hypothetical protein